MEETTLADWVSMLFLVYVVGHYLVERFFVRRW